VCLLKAKSEYKVALRETINNSFINSR